MFEKFNVKLNEVPVCPHCEHGFDVKCIEIKIGEEVTEIVSCPNCEKRIALSAITKVVLSTDGLVPVVTFVVELSVIKSWGR